MGKLLLFLWIITGPLQASVSEQVLLKARNKIPGEEKFQTHFVVTSDKKGNLLHFEKRKVSKKGQLLFRAPYTLYQLKEGAVIDNRDGYDIVIAKLKNLIPAQSAVLEIQYLKNALTDAMGKLKLNLTWQNGRWNVSHKKAMVDELMLLPKKVFLLGTVGIDQIKVIQRNVAQSEQVKK